MMAGGGGGRVWRRLSLPTMRHRRRRCDRRDAHLCCDLVVCSDHRHDARPKVLLAEAHDEELGLGAGRVRLGDWQRSAQLLARGLGIGDPQTGACGDGRRGPGQPGGWGWGLEARECHVRAECGWHGRGRERGGGGGGGGCVHLRGVNVCR